jgi:2-succinyl-5-enolpyruvyl-6-hydroxy-3-cyclohexene-1-carboxylate synthase
VTGADAVACGNTLLADALLDELVRGGVRHIVVCPGSRSTPLAAAAARLARRLSDLRVVSLLDERSAGFFALGVGKWSRAPAAVICTSGTAVANLYPAVVEASLSCAPLLVLSADRPPELRDWGAAQTIDQVRLFGSYVRWYAELPLPEASTALLRHARALASRAVAQSLGRPPGPVHLNLPYREPLEPVQVPESLRAAAGREARSYTRVSTAVLAPSESLVAALVTRLASAPHGVIAAGPLDDPDAELGPAVVRLARALGWPFLAEPTSQLRCGAHASGGSPLAAHYDAFLRSACFAGEHAPQIVLRLGAPLTSKCFGAWLERHERAELWVVDPGGRFADPTHRAAEILRCEPAPLCAALAAALETLPRTSDSSWLAAFLAADRRAEVLLRRELERDDHLLGPRVVPELAALLPEGATLFVSNSLPVRDLDLLLPASTRALRVLCNRGANGIDGISSTALGAAAAGARPLVLLTGDLALLHDVGGLAAARRAQLDATIVVVNNDGGGIFSLLPIAAHGEGASFEELFATPHGVDLAHAAALYGAGHARVRSWEHLRLALKQSLSAPGLHLIEVPVDRPADTAHRRALAARAAEAGGAA